MLKKICMACGIILLAAFIWISFPIGSKIVAGMMPGELMTFEDYEETLYGEYGIEWSPTLTYEEAESAVETITLKNNAFYLLCWRKDIISATFDSFCSDYELEGPVAYKSH